MDEFEEIKLYNNEVTVLYRDRDHSYWLLADGKKKRLKGCTTIIGLLDKPGLIGWAVRTTVDYLKSHPAELKKNPNELLDLAKEAANQVRDEAGEIGHAIHSWIESHILNQKPEMPTDEQVLNGVNSFLEWITNEHIKFTASEVLVYSRKYNYCGRMDAIARIDGKLYLVDFKTGNRLYPEVRLQTAAYQMAYEEQTGEKVFGRIAILISKDDVGLESASSKPVERFKLSWLDRPKNSLKTDFKAFKHLLDIYQWKKDATI